MASLKKKQKELEMIALVVEFVNKITGDEKDYPEVANRVKELFVSFSNRVIQAAEKPVKSSQPLPPSSRPVPQGVPDTTPKDLPASPPAGDVSNKIKFAMAYRHLENAKVKIGEAEGIVRGLDAPNLVVMLSNGTQMEVAPDKVTVVQAAQRKTK